MTVVTGTSMPVHTDEILVRQIIAAIGKRNGALVKSNFDKNTHLVPT